MSRRELGRTIQGITSFEDLKGLRAEGYIRDSTLDQRDGFGPEIQRHNIERFSNSYGLELGRRWYTEFVSGRNTQHRSQFRKFLEDARLDAFDVLLVDQQLGKQNRVISCAKLLSKFVKSTTKLMSQ